MAVVALGACGVCLAVEQTFVEEFRCRQQSIGEASSAIEAPAPNLSRADQDTISVTVSRLR
jgi:hypothetical protein